MFLVFRVENMENKDQQNFFVGIYWYFENSWMDCNEIYCK